MNDNYVSEGMFLQRIVSHGQVTDLSKPFKLKDEQPFSVYIRPKAATTEVDVMLSARLYKEDECAPVPVTIHAWQELEIVELDSTNKTLLEKYDIYWGAGNTGIPHTSKS